MSNFSANTLMPLFNALPEEEQHVFVEKARKLLEKKDNPKRKRKTTNDRVAEKLGEQWRPENREMLITQIMNGK